MSEKECYDRLNLRQLGELEFLLLGDLRDVLEEEASEQNRKWLLAVVEALLKTIPREFAIREQDGYLQEVVDCCPEVDSEVQALLREHQSLRTSLTSLRDQLYTLRPFRTQASALKIELAQWMRNLQRHNYKEEKLVQNAYMQDVGVGD